MADNQLRLGLREQSKRPGVQILGELEPPRTSQANGPRPEGRRVQQRVCGNVVTGLKCQLRIKRVVDEERKFEAGPSRHPPEIQQVG